MHKRTKVLLYILGALVVVAVAVLIWWNQRASADNKVNGIFPPFGGGAGIVGYFGDLTVHVTDKRTGAAVPNVGISFKGVMSNDALAKLGTTCSSPSLITDSDGYAKFTKANGSKNLKTWSSGSISFVTQEGTCNYTVSIVTPPPVGVPSTATTVGMAGYNMQTLQWSWPDRPAQNANLGTNEVKLEKVGPGTIRATLNLAPIISSATGKPLASVPAHPLLSNGPMVNLYKNEAYLMSDNSKKAWISNPVYDGNTGIFQGTLKEIPAGKYRLYFYNNLNILGSNNKRVNVAWELSVADVALNPGETNDIGTLTMLRK